MFFSPSRNFVFVHIPKTGGTSLSLALEHHQLNDDVHVGDTPKATWYPTQKTAGTLWKHSTLMDLKGLVDTSNPELTVATIVRHPMDRIVSMFHYLREQNFDHPAANIARSHDFRAFVYHPQIAKMMAGGAMARYLVDHDGRLRCNLVLNQERLHDDIAQVEEYLGIKLQLPRVNQSQRGPWQDYFDSESFVHWYKVSKIDFDVFGYPKTF